jgi:hypothetical protein
MNNAPLIPHCRRFLRELDKQLELAPAREAELREEITGLEDLEAQLQREMGYLKPQVVGSEDAAGKLYAKEVRLREVQARLEELRTLVSQLKPVNLQGANAVIEGIVRHYLAHLPSLIFEANKFISPEYEDAMAMVKMSEAWRVLHRLRTWQGFIEDQRADSSFADDLRGVIDRALRGQLHLGRDFKEEYPPEPDENSAAPGTAPAAPAHDGENTTAPATPNAPDAEPASSTASVAAPEAAAADSNA